MTVIVRFPPSPTGFLHIGNARTALFNWLFAKHHGGKFLLRIEDTDRARSTEPAIQAIFDGLTWLGLGWDGDVVYQFSRAEHHAALARKLIDQGRAYYCYASPEELDAMRAEQAANNLPQRYDGRWRDRDPAEAPPGVKPVLRLKAPTEGVTTVTDLVLGEVTIPNSQMDDMVLLRADGTPTYMLAVVIDDHDCGVTHVIRGADHHTNTFRQVQIYKAFDWDIPIFAHLPMITGPDGAKFSKRHGAPGVGDYREMGYLPEALCNYLLRLGWGHGDDEIISREQAIAWFDTDGIGKSPARFDFAKLDNLNAHYIREADDERLLGEVATRLHDKIGRDLSDIETDRLRQGMPALKARAKTLVELAGSAEFFIQPATPDEKTRALLASGKDILQALTAELKTVEPFTHDAIEVACRALAEAQGLKLGAVAQPLRAALTGSTVSPPIFEVAAILGLDESLKRIGGVLAS
jgi:glutamyl-tRNA synthetase